MRKNNMLPVLLEVKDGNVQVISAHILQEVVIRNIDRGDKPFSSEEIDHIILAHTCTIDNDITIPPGDLTPTFTDDYPYETISTVVDVEIQKLHEKGQPLAVKIDGCVDWNCFGSVAIS
jgi:hypothetical protein